MAETDETPGRRRYRKRGELALAELPRTTVRLRPTVGRALDRHATATGETKNETIERALARELGVELP